MYSITKVLVYSFLLIFISMACDNFDDKDKDEIPENVIQIDGLYHVWKWDYTINLNSNDSAYATDYEITFTFTEDGYMYEKEDSVTVREYKYYVTTETKLFDGDTLNKIYYFKGDDLAFTKFFYFPTVSELIERDELGLKAHFTLKE